MYRMDSFCKNVNKNIVILKSSLTALEVVKTLFRFSEQATRVVSSVFDCNKHPLQICSK